MKLAFDTSVLVAAVLEAHPHHERTRPWIGAIASGDIVGVMSWHAASETWSVLTRLPGDMRLPAASATLVIDRLVENLQPLEVSGPAYREAFRRCGERGARSGAIFDALHLVVAEMEGADALVTFNRGDFERLGRDGSTRIVVPPDPPGLEPIESGR